jgi:hypothetical protein
MNTQSPDTNVKSEQMLISLLREKSAAKKFAMIRSLSQSTIQLSKRAIARANEGIEDDQLNVLFIDLHYGKELAQKFKKHIDEKHENA